ncbi:MAG: hypothetical protein HFG54_11910 [Lachnospiraceae bacterium]|jgi:hypothetical protein|nr:hypothetical protein [Lachnospiraceae bacterium]
MTYLQCLPDPAIVTKEDCEKIHEIIGRLSLNRNIKIDAVPSNFKQYSAPENHRKYLFNMRPERNDGFELSQPEREMILNICENEYEKQLMENYIYTYGYNGTQEVRTFYRSGKSRMEKRYEAWLRRVEQARKRRLEKWLKLEAEKTGSQEEPAEEFPDKIGNAA